jgi:hypothetical protein
MPIDIVERARRYVAKMPPAISGQGGHNSTFAAAVALVKGFDLTIEQARPILAEYNQRCEPAWSVAELEHKLTSASGTVDDRKRGWLIGEPGIDGKKSSPPRAQEITTPKPKPKFDNEKLKAFAARWRPHVNTAWLADRSFIDPFNLSADEFLASLYEASEYVLVFTNQTSQGDAVWPRDTLPVSSPEGVWFLIQPVDGKVHPNPRSLDKEGQPKFSRRSEESVTRFRFLVLESDEADPRDWIGALVQLYLPIAAIYTSGKRSIHVLIRCDADSIGEWRDFSASVMKPIFIRLGADEQVVATSVRLSRLPGSLREGWTDKKGEYHRFKRPQLQKLLYLNPAPKVKPICALEPVRDSISLWRARSLKFLPPDVASVIESANAQNLNEVIQALETYEKPLPDSTHSFENCLTALDWFSTSHDARELLARLRAHAPDEFNQRNQTSVRETGARRGTN